MNTRPRPAALLALSALAISAAYDELPKVGPDGDASAINYGAGNVVPFEYYAAATHPTAILALRSIDEQLSTLPALTGTG